MNSFEIIGIVGSLFIIFSVSFASDNEIGNLKMRVLNSVGSIFFIIYGFIIPAYSTAFLNLVMLVVNLNYIVKIKKRLNNDPRI